MAGCGRVVGWQLQLRFDPLAWELPYAAGGALKRPKKKKKGRVGAGEEGRKEGVNVAFSEQESLTPFLN